MSWKLIRSIQSQTDLRLILPFGLYLRIGDVVSVGRDGGLTLEGDAQSLLGVPVGKPRPAGLPLDIFSQSGKDTSYSFRVAGAVSPLFPQVVSGNTGFDISFSSSEAWLLALVQRRIQSLDQLHRFGQPILDAYRHKVWKADWVLITSIAQVDRITLLASQTKGTNIAMALSGRFPPNAPVEVKMTAEATIVASNSQFTKCISTTTLPAFCSGLRVRDGFWTDPNIRSLATPPPDAPEPGTLWEDMDTIAPPADT